jgi:hypothetical protein
MLEELPWGFSFGILTVGRSRVCTLKSFPRKNLELEHALIPLLVLG